MTNTCVIKFGRLDGSADKVLFIPGRKVALTAANALSKVLMGGHRFRHSESHVDQREESAEFYVEFIPPESPNNRTTH